jgi:hypothetical protein
MLFPHLAFAQTAHARATACVALAVLAVLLTVSVPLLDFLLADRRPGGYAQLVAAALALFSIYCGLVRRYLVRATEFRVRIGILMSLAVLAYLAYAFTRLIWE